MNFKTIIIVITASFIFANTLYSQDCYTDKKHEINLGYFNIFELINSNNLGIGYKYHFNQSAVRLNANFDYTKSEYEKDIDYGSIFYNSRYYISDYIKYNIKIGYEFHININKFQVFYGSDFIYNSLTSIRDYGYEYYNGIEYEVEAEYTERGSGISPFIGIKYFLNKRISISSETNINILFQQKSSFYNLFSQINNQTLESTATQTEIGLIPLGLITINFHL